jgi:hypothetical protein
MSDTTTTDSGLIAEDFDQATGEIFDTPTAQPVSAGSLVIQDAISRLQSGVNTRVFSTVQGDDFDAKLKVMSAVSTATPIMEHLGKHIELENIVVQAVELTDPTTNMQTTQPRVILLDADGSAYYGISPVLLKAIETFVGVLGQPATWPAPLGVKVTREKGNRGFSFFNLILDPKGRK